MAYDKNENYQKKIDEAVARGDYASASAYEKQRNEKIDGEGLNQYTKTYNYVIPKGMSGEQYNKVNSTFKVGDKYNNYQEQADTNLNKYQTHADSDMISSGTKSKLNTSFNMPNSVKQADRWLANQLDIIQSGKTTYTDQVRDMMDKIMNREKFSYDVDNDTMFQQALSSAMKSGQAAMQNTIGQASALTGGYSSTYATTAGNQAYNSFIEDAYNNLPEYYQMALDAYNSEGENMFRQYGMLSEADEKEYNRNIAAYDATYQHRNQMYNEAYGRFRDERSDAFAMADLEMREYTQRGNDIYNLYAMYADAADKEYQRQYQPWHDDVTMAFEMGKLGQSDFWNQYGYDFEAIQNQLNREHETSERLGRQSFETSEREASQDFTTQRDEILQGYTDKNMATEHSYNKEILDIEQGNKKELMDIEQGYTDKNMATQHGYDVAMEGIRHDNDMEKINTQNDFQAGENQKDRDWKSGESQKDRDWKSGESQKDREHDTSEREANQAWQDSNREDNQAHDVYMQNDAQAYDSSENALARQSKGSGGSPSNEKPISFTDTEIATIKEMFGNGASDQEVIDYLYTKGKYITQDDLWMIDMYKDSKKKEDVLTPNTTGLITNSGMFASFKPNVGDNFKVTVGKNSYTVENRGLANENAHAILDNLNVKDGQVFAYDDDGTVRVYVKKDNKYYKVGATLTGGGEFKNLKQALQR